MTSNTTFSVDDLLDYFNVKEEEAPKRARNEIIVYGGPFVYLVGVVGNVLALTVMPHFARRVSTYMYLLILCILDLCVLHLGLLVNWLREILEIDLHSQSNFSCKTLTFLGYVCSDSSVWLVVAVTFERFMTMCHPLKATSLCRIRQALLVIIFILVFIFLINLHIFWTIGLIPDGNNSTVCGQQKDITLIWPCVDLMVYFVIPFLSTGIFNYKIIRKIRGMKRNSQRNISLATVKAFLTKKTNVRRKLTVMMVILSLTFVITTFPMVCMLCVTAVLNTLSHPLDINRQLFNKMFSFAELLMFTNHAINFYLYVASSRKFRKALRQVLCECKVSDASVFEHSENKYTNNYVAANTLYS